MSVPPVPNLARPKRKREQRRDAAEEVCWKILILMGIGELEGVPMRLRAAGRPDAEVVRPQPEGAGLR